MNAARRSAGTLATLLALVAAASGAASADPQPAGGAVARAGDRQVSLAAGVQLVPKQRTRATVEVRGRTVAAANPYLSLVADPAAVDWSYWRSWLARGAERPRSAAAAATDRGLGVPTPLAHAEREPAGSLGVNDSQAKAEQLRRVGIGRRFQAVRIRGRLEAVRPRVQQTGTREDQGSIPRATDTGIPARRDGVLVESQIGDGPHGSGGTGNGDFDFFAVDAAAGESIRADTVGSDIDTVLVVYDSSGTVVAQNDDVGNDIHSELFYDVSTSGRYFVMVTGFPALPSDPFASGSGSGLGEEGAYRLNVVVGPVDRDYYALRLRSGDVLGGSLGGAATTVTVHRVDGQSMVGSSRDPSSLYPGTTPLPGGGAAFAYVAEEPGWYAVSARDGVGDYRLLLELYRPGSELDRRGRFQTVFLDFDGARTNTAVLGGSGVVTLSPLRRFMARWGLPRSATGSVVDAVVAEVRENVRRTLRSQGLNGRLRVRILNSRDHRDPFGAPDVSRVIVGGTVRQAGIDTIGIAQSIDPGNYAHEETALVLLDILSIPGRIDEASLNTYLTRASDRVGFIGQAVGNVVSHEIGHYLGSFHTDQTNPVHDLMDQGGSFPEMFGVGLDGVGGTSDDVDVDFGEDHYVSNEFFTGLEDGLNIGAWALGLGAR